eukprot:TRINITY_DN811_c0_g1_i1.p1 TRINITY_DN811_c0_g1~~TRINITY_DN811_c0_g1_i1.p1  ORF type:complete len:230 (+),score=42.28 TRINITY_DN811_c0_g1_i1:460-1149(+)
MCLSTINSTLPCSILHRLAVSLLYNGLKIYLSTLSEVVIEDARPCLACEKTSFPSKTLLCDSCDDPYHIFCLPQKLDKVPTGQWLCPSCAILDQNFQLYNLKKEDTKEVGQSNKRKQEDDSESGKRPSKKAKVESSEPTPKAKEETSDKPQPINSPSVDNQPNTITTSTTPPPSTTTSIASPAPPTGTSTTTTTTTTTAFKGKRTRGGRSGPVSILSTAHGVSLNSVKK